MIPAAFRSGACASRAVFGALLEQSKAKQVVEF
jgi:hypothetical protein